jgi:hypothetical protein
VCLTLSIASHDPAREDDAKPGSDRAFGNVMAIVFAAIAVFKLWQGSPLWWIWLAIGAIFAAMAWLRPSVLRPLNYVWFHFGLLLHRIVSPIVMALIFFAAVLPVGLLMRLFGNRPLTPKFEPGVTSYWVPRHEGTPPPGSMKNQF